MATLISVGSSDGTEGRCDARCYNADHPQCDCVCGGRNHGVGLKQAQENTSEMANSLIKKYGKGKVVFPDEGKQLQLF